MSETIQVIKTPNRNDLMISGELIKIEIYHNSFNVFWQMEGSEDRLYQLQFRQTIYPIKYLVKFFKVNGSADKNYFIQRPKALLEFTSS